MQSGGFLGRLLEPLMKVGLPLRKNVLQLLAKSVLIPLALLSASAADSGIHKKILALGTATVVSNEEMEYILRIV